jgi:hypothetical protein
MIMLITSLEPGPDGGEAQVAGDAFSTMREHVGVADAAHDLHGVVGHLLARFGDELLGLADHAGACRFGRNARIDGIGRWCRRAAGGVQQHGRLGHLEADALELGDGRPKALRRVVYPPATSRAGRAAPMVMAAVPSRSGSSWC